MQWLLPVGVVLTLLGLGGSVGACYQSTRNVEQESGTASTAPDGGVPADRSDGSSLAPMVLGPLAGLVLACGIGCIAVGMGHWNRPVASSTRPANPWNEQPRDKGDPPVGLV